MFTPTKQYTGEKKDFTPVVPEDGLQVMQVSLLVDLGQHEKLPRFAKDSSGNVELDENGQKKIIMPNKELSPRGERKDLDAKISVYVDLLNQTHDYEGDIGVRNIRLPLVEPVMGIAEGINWTTTAPRDGNGKYIQGRAWTLAPTSKWAKLADVTRYPDGKKVKDVIFEPSYSNPKLNDVRELLGKPFMANLDVKKQDRDGKTFINTRIKSYVPLAKGFPVGEALITPIAIRFDDVDLTVPLDCLGGATKLDMLRIADLRRITLAVNYQGSNMQKAIVEKYGTDGEAELVAKSKELFNKKLSSDKEYSEILSLLAKPAEKAPAKTVEKAAPVQEEDDFEDDIPF